MILSCFYNARISQSLSYANVHCDPPGCDYKIFQTCFNNRPFRSQGISTDECPEDDFRGEASLYPMPCLRASFLVIVIYLKMRYYNRALPQSLCNPRKGLELSVPWPPEGCQTTVTRPRPKQQNGKCSRRRGLGAALWWCAVITIFQLSLFLSLFFSLHREGSNAFAIEKMAYQSMLVKTNVQK